MLRVYEFVAAGTDSRTQLAVRRTSTTTKFTPSVVSSMERIRSPLRTPTRTIASELGVLSGALLVLTLSPSLLLDYAVVDDPRSEEPVARAKLPVAAVVVPVLLVVLVSVAGMIFLVLRKKRMQKLGASSSSTSTHTVI